MTDQPLHAEVSKSESTQSVNPISSSLNVVVSIPDSIEIKMVDASILTDYEVWFFISSLLSSAFFGFFVAYIQGREVNTPSTTSLGCMAMFIALLLAISIAMAFHKRNCLKKKGKTINLKASSIES